QAMEHESGRQKKLLQEGGELVQETRGWIDEAGITVLQRTKEYANDYRYFPEPDLPPLILDRARIEEIQTRLPELPEARRDRFVAEYGLPVYDANILTGSRAMADYFESCIKLMDPGKAKTVSNWLSGDFSRLLNATNTDVENVRISPEYLTEMLDL
ncbi:unnamed protein product, partial [marine sediment metagenome]